jgi:hypothetical protein
MNNITKTRTVEINEKKYGIITISLENAISVYIYQETPRLGTLGISVPSTTVMPASTLYITGKKDEHFVRMIGERLATNSQKLVIVSLNVEDANNELLLKLQEEIELALKEE